MDSEATSSIKVSFGVKKKIETKVETNAAVIQLESDHSDGEEEYLAKKRKLTHLENGMLSMDDDVPSKKSKNNFVIPLVKEMDWRVAKLMEMEKNGTISDEDRARLALLTEGELAPNMPITASTTEEIAVTVEGASMVVEDADYNAIPIESFGIAILRGCGWKDGEGIGKKPQIVPLRISQQRPKGLGLGALPPKPTKGMAKTKEEEEELGGEIKQGSLVKITVKPNIGRYGTIEGRDDDNNSCFVRLTIGKKLVRVSLYGVVKVTKREYDSNAHILNRENYEIEARRLEAERDAQRKTGDEEGNNRVKENRGDRRDDRYRENGRTIESKEVWVRPNMMVRFINDDYRKGRYMGQKMLVVDVTDARNLTLEDNEKKHHYEIRQSWLETVVPKDQGERVMIVRGKRKGEVAVVEERNRKRETLVLRLLSNNEIVKVVFDDACMWKPPLHYESD